MRKPFQNQRRVSLLQVVKFHFPLKYMNWSIIWARNANETLQRYGIEPTGPMTPWPYDPLTMPYICSLYHIHQLFHTLWRMFSACWGKVNVIFAIARKVGFAVPHSKKCEIRVPSYPQSHAYVTSRFYVSKIISTVLRELRLQQSVIAIELLKQIRHCVCWIQNCRSIKTAQQSGRIMLRRDVIAYDGAPPAAAAAAVALHPSSSPAADVASLNQRLNSVRPHHSICQAALHLTGNAVVAAQYNTLLHTSSYTASFACC